MIFVRLSGGLGNQMFHYAAARGYQRNDDDKIILDTRLIGSELGENGQLFHRSFALDIFKKLKARPLEGKFGSMITSPYLSDKIRRKILYFLSKTIVQHLTAPVSFKPISQKTIRLKGDFQSDYYFKWLRADLLNEFSFPELDTRNEQIKQAILKTENAVSIHIRRGDYLTSKYRDIYSSVNLQYYKNAIEALLKQTSLQHIDCYLFTDDVSWVKENFLFEKLKITFVEGNEDKDSWKDMALMSFCRHHIIANSSFSWWGAWLSQRQGITMAPRYWFMPGTYTYNINELIPDNWKIIDYNI